NWPDQRRRKSGRAYSNFQQLCIPKHNEIEHSRHSQAAHDLGRSENFHLNQRSKQQRSKEKPRPAALLQVPLETKQARKKETQSGQDWIRVEEWQDCRGHTEITKRPINFFAQQQAGNK